MEMSAYVCVCVCVLCICSVQFSHSIVSDSLQPHESKHARPSCPSPIPRVHSNLCPSSQWCHPAISSSVIPSLLPALNPFQHQGLFQWVNSSHEVAKHWSFSFNISPSNEHPGLISFRMDWFPICRGVKQELLMRELDDFPFESERRNGYGWIDLA